MELFNSALYLHRQLLALKSSIPPTPTAEDSLNDSSAVPNILYNCLAWVFCGDKANGPAESEITAAGEKVIVERDKTHRHIMSVAQDVVPITAQGRVIERQSILCFLLLLNTLQEVRSWLLCWTD